MSRPCFPQTNGNEGGAGGPISCQLHWRNWHYSSFLIDDYDDDGEVDDDRDTQCCRWYNFFGDKCTKSECIITVVFLHQKSQ